MSLTYVGDLRPFIPKVTFGEFLLKPTEALGMSLLSSFRESLYLNATLLLEASTDSKSVLSITEFRKRRFL